ncbi:hypothetical protein NN561_010496 [Cricetulus griseus]
MPDPGLANGKRLGDMATDAGCKAASGYCTCLKRSPQHHSQETHRQQLSFRSNTECFSQRVFCERFYSISLDFKIKHRDITK